jgi:hypothetical protein
MPHGIKISKMGLEKSHKYENHLKSVFHGENWRRERPQYYYPLRFILKHRKHIFSFKINEIYLYPSATVQYNPVLFGDINVDAYVDGNDVEGFKQTERQGR